MDTSQYLSMFLEESMDNLQSLNEALLELEQNPENLEKINEIFRVAHTIKGMAATMGFNYMADLTHNMEDVLAKFRTGELKADHGVVTVLFKCLDTLEQMVNNVSENSNDEFDISDIIRRLKSISNEKAAEIVVSIEENQKVNVELSGIKKNIKENLKLNEYDISVVNQANDRGFNVFNIGIVLEAETLLKSARAFLIFQSLEECGEIIKSFPSAEDIENENFDREIDLLYISNISKKDIEDIIVNISEIQEVIVEKIEIQQENKNDSTVEVQKENKDIKGEKEKPKDINKKEEIVVKPIENNDEQKNTKKKVHQSVRVDLERLDKFLTMVSELVIHRTRLEEISSRNKYAELNETLEQVGRTTSDLQDLVMKIRMLPLEIVFNRFPRMIRDLSLELGKEIELTISGSETELDRTVIDEIGEPLIHLLRNAADHGIESTEERIAKGKSSKGNIKLSAYSEGTKAVIKVEDDGKGLDIEKIRAKAEKVGINTSGMNESDIKNLIFAQGFSTSEKVSDISGRGVGMDVVKTKISSLGGTVEVISEKNKGTTFIVRLPLTLQIIKALLVKVGEETMAISLGYIDRVLDFSKDMVKKTNNKEVIIYNDEIIPLIRINEKLNIPAGDDTKDYIVVAKVGEKNVGLLTNGLLGQQQIVIKPLGKTLQSVKEYIGATILGDGLVTLILDVAAII